MLTRLRYRRDFRLFARYFADQPSDSDGIPPENKTAHGKDTKSTNTSTEKTSKESSTEKIQALLKSMMTAKPQMSESEYSEKFTVAPDRRRKQKSDEVEVKTEQIEENITKAASEVAQAIGGDVKQTEAELLSKVLGKINQTSTSLSDLIIGMKVDRTKDSDDFVKTETRGQQVKRLVEKSRDDPMRTTRYSQRKYQQIEGKPSARTQQLGSKRSLPQATSVDIFGGAPLGIFKAAEPNYGTRLDVWEGLKQRELDLATSQPPANYFQKMVQWTEQGKVWRFPIDNEQGMEEEQNIHFSEHVFIDSHLEGWCPRKGPIRHFMELVCVGLSKNAFYTAKEKKDHIMWYKEYFESKKELLTEVGAWDSEVIPKSSEAST